MYRYAQCRYVWMLLLELQVAMQRACAGCVGEGRVAQCALYTALMCSQLGEERRVHSPPVLITALLRAGEHIQPATRLAANCPLTVGQHCTASSQVLIVVFIVSSPRCFCSWMSCYSELRSFVGLNPTEVVPISREDLINTYCRANSTTPAGDPGFRKQQETAEKQRSN